MSDGGYIKIVEPVSPGIVEGVVVPGIDGIYVIEAMAHHRATGHGSPLMWLTIDINDKNDYESKRIQWQDGPASMPGITTEPMKAGVEYRVVARSWNENADATGITMKIARI